MRTISLMAITQETYDRSRKALAEYFEGHTCTCDDCKQRLHCPGAGDPYNTDGDCLMEK